LNGNEITNGVHEITIARTVSGADRSDVASDALIMAEDQLGSNLSNNVDYGKAFSNAICVSTAI
jgi:hypothetical protein